MTTYRVSDRGLCPHCNVTVQFVGINMSSTFMVQAKSEIGQLNLAQCPHCGRLIIAFEAQVGSTLAPSQLLYPKNMNRPPIPTDVPNHIAQDYREATLVLELSPKASAALSRRCLQTVLSEAGQTKSHDLIKQIDEVSPSLPGYLAEVLHAVRQIGNFAAHAQKSQVTGSILDVEAGEAEWNLDVLDELFDHYYVKPALQQKKKQNLNQKLQEAGKPLLK